MKFCAFCTREIVGRLSTGSRAYCNTRCRNRAAALRKVSREVRAGRPAFRGPGNDAGRGAVGTVDPSAQRRDAR